MSNSPVKGNLSSFAYFFQRHQTKSQYCLALGFTQGFLVSPPPLCWGEFCPFYPVPCWGGFDFSFTLLTASRPWASIIQSVIL